MNNGELHRILALSRKSKEFAQEITIEKLNEIRVVDRLDIDLMKNVLYETIRAYDNLDCIIEIEKAIQKELNKINDYADRYRNPNETDIEECDE